MAFRCTNCGHGPFEADDGRCPQCLRRGTVVDVNAPVPRDPDLPNPWLAVPLLFAFTALGVAMTWFGIWDLTERAASNSWPRTSAKVTAVQQKRLRCEVDYEFSVGSASISGHTERFACPRFTDEIVVWYDALDPTRHRAQSNIGVFLDLFSIVAGALFFAMMGGILLFTLFPQNDRFIRFAARVGSKHARAALARR